MLRPPLMESSRSIHPAPNFSFKKSRVRVGAPLLNALQSLNQLKHSLLNTLNQFDTLDVTL